MLHFIARVAGHSAKTGMELGALATVFGNIFMRPKSESAEQIVKDMPQVKEVFFTLLNNRYQLRFTRPEGKREWSVKLRNQPTQLRALYDYAAQGKKNSKGETDIGFKKGDIMVCIETRPTGWTLARFNDQLGVAPSNYVEKIESNDNDEVMITVTKKGKKAKVPKRKNMRKKTSSTDVAELTRKGSKSDIKEENRRNSKIISEDSPKEKRSSKIDISEAKEKKDKSLKRDKRQSQAPTSAEDVKDKYIKKLEEEVTQLKAKLREYEARFSGIMMPPAFPPAYAPPPTLDVDFPEPPPYQPN